MAEDAFVAKKRAVQAAVTENWWDLVAARRAAMVRAATLRDTFVTRTAVASWRCFLQVCHVGRAGCI